MLIFVDDTETKGYESLVTMADVIVETFDVAACLEGPIWGIDVETNTYGLVNQVDKACDTTSLILKVDVATDNIELILTREVATSTKIEIQGCKIEVAN